MENEKFIWQHNDIEFVKEDDFNETAILYSSKESKPFSICEMKSDCLLCDPKDQETATFLAAKIYNSYFANGNKDIILVRKVLKNYIALCKKLLPQSIVLTKQLYCCARMCLFDILRKNGFSEDEIKCEFGLNG